MSAQTEQLTQKYEELKVGGVIDVKFLFSSLQGVALDDVCASATEILDAIQREDYVEIPPIGERKHVAA